MRQNNNRRAELPQGHLSFERNHLVMERNREFVKNRPNNALIQLEKLRTKPRQESNRGLTKSGFRQITDNSNSIWRSAVERSIGYQLWSMGEYHCSLSNFSLDSNQRPQRKMRVILPPETNERFISPKAYHVTWCQANPDQALNPNLDYSHRCHNKTCVEPTHGVWETVPQNNSRNKCQGGSHVFLPNGRYLLLCPHDPSCLVAIQIPTYDDPRLFTCTDEETFEDWVANDFVEHMPNTQQANQ